LSGFGREKTEFGCRFLQPVDGLEITTQNLRKSLSKYSVPMYWAARRLGGAAGCDAAFFDICRRYRTAILPCKFA